MKVEWPWGPGEQTALASAPVLSYYDATRPTVVSADASSYGLRVMLQQHGEDWKLLQETQDQVCSIRKKECLASVWACERFKKYLFGLHSFKLITNHKPLVALINSKDLDNVHIRCQRLLMKLMYFNAEADPLIPPDPGLLHYSSATAAT